MSSHSEHSIGQLLLSSTEILSAVSDSAQLDTEVLLSFVLNKNRSYLRAFPEVKLTTEQHTTFAQLIQRRKKGEPVAHITGQREFWSLNLDVTADTLIPRPDTEILIEFILEKFPQQSAKMIDLGTGTGAIAIAIACEKPEWQITATDQSRKALDVAKKNASRHAIKNINFIESNWFEKINQTDFNIIISNPPYICENDSHLQQGDVRFEPLTALASGVDGLDDIRHLIKHAPKHLAVGGWLVLEHGYDQKATIKQLLDEAGFMDIIQLDDYGQNPRLSAAHI